MLRFGTQISLDHPWGELGSVPGYAKQLEEWGYDYIWCPDERFERSPYVVLTLAARATEQVKLGVSVTNPYTRHPLITGAAAATVNEASGGRAVLGLGAGASSLFERQGMERPSLPVASIREAVEILTTRPKWKNNVRLHRLPVPPHTHLHRRQRSQAPPACRRDCGRGHHRQPDLRGGSEVRPGERAAGLRAI